MLLIAGFACDHTMWSEVVGALAGRYRVLVRPPPNPGRGEDDPRRYLPLIDPRYTRFETSGLEFEVRPGKNEFTIEVEKPRAGRPKR